MKEIDLPIIGNPHHESASPQAAGGCVLRELLNFRITADSGYPETDAKCMYRMCLHLKAQAQPPVRINGELPWLMPVSGEGPVQPFLMPSTAGSHVLHTPKRGSG